MHDLRNKHCRHATSLFMTKMLRLAEIAESHYILLLPFGFLLGGLCLSLSLLRKKLFRIRRVHELLHPADFGFTGFILFQCEDDHEFVLVRPFRGGEPRSGNLQANAFLSLVA